MTVSEISTLHAAMHEHTVHRLEFVHIHTSLFSTSSFRIQPYMAVPASVAVCLLSILTIHMLDALTCNRTFLP
jgi:hypothetical protein